MDTWFCPFGVGINLKEVLMYKFYKGAHHVDMDEKFLVKQPFLPR